MPLNHSLSLERNTNILLCSGYLLSWTFVHSEALPDSNLQPWWAEQNGTLQDYTEPPHDRGTQLIHGFSVNVSKQRKSLRGGSCCAIIGQQSKLKKINFLLLRLWQVYIYWCETLGLHMEQHAMSETLATGPVTMNIWCPGNVSVLVSHATSRTDAAHNKYDILMHAQ